MCLGRKQKVRQNGRDLACRVLISQRSHFKLGCNDIPVFSSTRAVNLVRLLSRYSNSSIVPFLPAAFLLAFRRVLAVFLETIIYASETFALNENSHHTIDHLL